MYEFIDHTADAGFLVRATSRGEMFAEAARALNVLLLEHPENVRALDEKTIDLEADDNSNLLHDWLAELLFLFNARRMIFVQFQPVLKDNNLVATVWGEPLDPNRHAANMDVKAITYHQLRAEFDGKEWLAQVIVDI